MPVAPIVGCAMVAQAKGDSATSTARPPPPPLLFLKDVIKAQGRLRASSTKCPGDGAIAHKTRSTSQSSTSSASPIHAVSRAGHSNEGGGGRSMGVVAESRAESTNVNTMR